MRVNAVSTPVLSSADVSAVRACVKTTCTNVQTHGHAQTQLPTTMRIHTQTNTQPTTNNQLPPQQHVSARTNTRALARAPRYAWPQCNTRAHTHAARTNECEIVRLRECHRLLRRHLPQMPQVRLGGGGTAARARASERDRASEQTDVPRRIHARRAPCSPLASQQSSHPRGHGAVQCPPCLHRARTVRRGGGGEIGRAHV